MTGAQAAAEVYEWSQEGRTRYMRDFWNYIEGMIILLSLLLVCSLPSRSRAPATADHPAIPSHPEPSPAIPSHG